MIEQLKKYYTDKKLFWRIIVGMLVVIIILFQFTGRKWSMHLLSADNAFAGERMPTAGRYQLNIERFDREVALLQLNAAQFVMIYKRRGLIVPTIEKALKKAGLPDDLKYIPVIESALRENVSSSAGAAGIRQFMPWTAQKYGLIVNSGVDERFDVAKSTAAAITHLTNLYKKFGNRTLVAAAYNRGENGLQASIDNQFSNNYYDLRLNNETSRYVFRILAMKHVRENRYRFFDRDTLWSIYAPFDTENISVKQIENIAERAKTNGYSYYEVKKLNPRILKSSLPEGKRTIEVFNQKK